MLEEKYKILKNRPYQIETIEKILNSLDKKFIILNSPTGSGKTIMALVLADYLSKNNGKIIHIAVRTTEEIKRYIEDSFKVNTLLKVFPNKKKTCPIFIDSNLSGEEIICADCEYKNKIYDSKKLYSILKKAGYDFKKITKLEKLKIKNNKESKCIYHSFKKVESNIYISTYPYVFNLYLNEVLSLEGEPDILILDESHNLLTTIINPFSVSLKKYLEKGFGKRKENNLLYQELEKELLILREVLKIELEDYESLKRSIMSFSDDLISYIENILAKTFNTKDISIILSRMSKREKEIYVEREKLLEIFEKYLNQIESLLFYWETYKRYITKNKLKLPKKRWNIQKILKLYYNLQDKDIFWILNKFRIEGYITKFEKIIKIFNNYKNIILMSGSNFTKEEFAKLYKVNPKHIEYIKVNINLGKKNYEIITNFSSKFSIREDKNNIQNLLGNIRFIMDKFERYILFMFPSYGFMMKIFDLLDLETKNKIFLDNGEIPINRILKTEKECIFTYARSRFIEGIELVKDGKSLLKTIVIVGKPYPPPPNASILTYKILQDNNIDYIDFSETIKNIQIKQVIGRAIRYPGDEANIIFIDNRYSNSEIKKLLS